MLEGPFHIPVPQTGGYTGPKPVILGQLLAGRRQYSRMSSPLMLTVPVWGPRHRPCHLMTPSLLLWATSGDALEILWSKELTPGLVTSTQAEGDVGRSKPKRGRNWARSHFTISFHELPTEPYRTQPFIIVTSFGLPRTGVPLPGKPDLPDRALHKRGYKPWTPSKPQIDK